MEKVKKIAAICDVDFLKHPHCDFLSDTQKAEILADYELKRSLVVGFNINDSTEFVVVYNLTPRALHLEHVVGNFGRHHQALDTFSQSLARMCGYNQVTFRTERRAVARWADGAGYVPSEIDFHFVKRTQ